jgi:hypothetical protein
MANILMFQACSFKDEPHGTITFGYRIFDDYGSYYNNTFDSIEEVMEHATPDKIVKFLMQQEGEAVGDMIFHHGQQSRGMYINGIWHSDVDWDVD